MEAILTRSALPRPESRFTRLPDAILAVLTPREHQLLHALLSYRWSDDAPIFPRVGTLAKRLGCSERTVQRALRRLEAGGWIVTVARYRDDEARDRTSNEYRPGPTLLPLLPRADAAADTTSRPDWRRPVTDAPPKRDPRNQKTGFRVPERTYPRVATDPLAHVTGALGHLIRT